MADYKRMYYILCSAASEAIDATPEEAKIILQNALYDAENIYIETCDESDEQQ